MELMGYGELICGLGCPQDAVGRCIVGLAFAPGNIMKTLRQAPANLPYVRAGWARLAFHWSDYLAATFGFLLGTTNITLRVEALTNFTRQALNDTVEAIFTLNMEQQQIREVVLQNRMALGILTTAQGGTCAMIKSACCVYSPDYSENVSDSP